MLLSSWLIALAPLLHMWIASRIFLVVKLEFLSSVEAPCQSITWTPLLCAKKMGRSKLLVYHKKIHRDQYLNFHSQHPLYHKLGVVRTLMDHIENMVMEEADKQIYSILSKYLVRKKKVGNHITTISTNCCLHQNMYRPTSTLNCIRGVPWYPTFGFLVLTF